MRSGCTCTAFSLRSFWLLHLRVSINMVIAVGNVSFQVRKPGDKLVGPWRSAPLRQEDPVKVKVKAKLIPASRSAAVADAAGRSVLIEVALAPGRRRRRRHRGSAPIGPAPVATEADDSFMAYMVEVARSTLKAEPAEPYIAGRHGSPEAFAF